MSGMPQRHNGPVPLLAYRLRWKRRRLLARSMRSYRHLRRVQVDVRAIGQAKILGFGCVKNEAHRLPYFLDHHRALGVGHFLFVVNGGEDGTRDYLVSQPDCSVWETDAPYKMARFGMDWLGLLLWRFGHGKWCLTLDADELLVYPDCEARGLDQLTRWLDRRGQPALGAPLLDLYPKGPLADAVCAPGRDPREVLTHYDAWNTTHSWQPKQRNQWIQGGPRARMFFAGDPRRAPTLNKIPLVKWHRSYVYVTSTHILLPRHLNGVFDAMDELPLIGVLLHTKFLSSAINAASDPAHRAAHFENSALYDDYYRQLAANPTLWHDGSKTYRGLDGLAQDGVFWRLDWEN